MFNKEKRVGVFKYIKSTSWMFAESILRIAVGLFVGLWIARYLGPENFGSLSYAIAFVSLFAGIARLGFDGILIDQIVKHPERAQDYLITALSLRVYAALGVFFLIAIFQFVTNDSAEIIIYVLIIAFGQFFQVCDVFQMYFQAQVWGRLISICKIIQLMFGVLIKLLLIVSEAELVYFAIAAAVDSLVLSLLYVYFYKKSVERVVWFSCSLELASEMLVKSWPLIVAGLGFSIFSNIDSLILREMLGEFSLGVYMAAYKLVVLWYFLPGLLLTSAMPVLVDGKGRDGGGKSRLNFLVFVLFWFSVALSVATALMADFVIEITYGAKYSGAAELLRVLVWINVLIFFNSCWNTLQMLNNNNKATMYFHLTAAAINVALNFSLIPVFGLVGAAYAIVLSLVGTSIIFMYFDADMYKMFRAAIVPSWRG